MDWEEIDHYHERTMIPGGWILKTYSDETDAGYNIAICFIPDPDHLWEINND